MYYYRYTNSSTPVGDCGYHLWAQDPEASRHFGCYRYRLDVDNQSSDVRHVEDIIEDIASLLAEDYADGTLPYELDAILADYTPNEIARTLDPDNLVDSGGGWDDPIMVRWVWDRYLDERGIYTILTYDGAISFLGGDDPRIEYLGEVDWHL